MRYRPSTVLAGLYRLLRSNRLATAAIASAMAAILVWVIPFILYGLPQDRVDAIVYDELFTAVALGAIAVTSLVCTLGRLPRLLRRISKLPGSGSALALKECSASVERGFSATSARTALERAGFRNVVVSPDWCWGVRNRYATLGTLVFHLAIVLVAVGAGYAGLSGGPSAGSFLVTEGQTVTIANDDYFDRAGAGTLPTTYLRLDDLSAEFHEDILLFTKLQADVTARGVRKQLAVGHPLHIGVDQTLSLGDFGWSLEVREGSDETTASEVYALKVFPPGAPDEFKFMVEGHDYRFRVKAYGDHVVRDGKVSASSFNLKKPAILVDVFLPMTNGEESQVIDSAIVPIPGELEVGKGTVRFIGMTEHGVFRVSRSPGATLVLAGFFLAFLGAVVRLAFNRTECVVYRASDGSTSIAVKADVYGSDDRIAERISSELAGANVAQDGDTTA